jgi:hypothetical protein
VAELTNGTSARERGLWWSSSGGHRHGADSLKTEAEGEKMGWGSGPAARAMRRETSGRGGLVIHIRWRPVAVGKQERMHGGKAPVRGPHRFGGWWATGPAILGPAQRTVTFFI